MCLEKQHCWVGDAEKLIEVLRFRKEGEKKYLKNYSIYPYKEIKERKNEVINKVFYDMETCANVRRKDKKDEK